MDADVLLAAVGGFFAGASAATLFFTAQGRKIEWRRKFLLRTFASAFGGSQTRPRPHA